MKEESKVHIILFTAAALIITVINLITITSIYSPPGSLLRIFGLGILPALNTYLVYDGFMNAYKLIRMERER